MSLYCWDPYFNFAIGVSLSKEHARGRIKRQKWILALAITADVCLLGYYKYANFFVENANAAFSTGWEIEPILLPLGISFFTFTQIAFLVDAYRGEVKEPNFVHYGLFVTYFPHLIAGPVLHHKEMMPQFAKLHCCSHGMVGDNAEYRRSKLGTTSRQSYFSRSASQDSHSRNGRTRAGRSNSA